MEVVGGTGKWLYGLEDHGVSLEDHGMSQNITLGRLGCDVSYTHNHRERDAVLLRLVVRWI